MAPAGCSRRHRHPFSETGIHVNNTVLMCIQKVMLHMQGCAHDCLMVENNVLPKIIEQTMCHVATFLFIEAFTDKGRGGGMGGVWPPIGLF